MQLPAARLWGRTDYSADARASAGTTYTLVAHPPAASTPPMDRPSPASEETVAAKPKKAARRRQSQAAAKELRDRASRAGDRASEATARARVAARFGLHRSPPIQYLCMASMTITLMSMRTATPPDAMNSAIPGFLPW